MFRLEQVTQALVFVSLILMFELYERFRPGFDVVKTHELGLNTFAMLIVIFVGEQEKVLVQAGMNSLNLLTVMSRSVFFNLPSPIKILIGIPLLDLTLYWVHRYMHKPLLWPTHAFHHSIGELWWLSGSRTSLTHLLLFVIPQTFIAYFLLGLSPTEASVALSFGVFINLWIHINVWVKIGPLDKIFITPNYHRVHHGGQGLTKSNLGFVLTLWDHIFGTYKDPETVGKGFALFPVPTKNRLLRMIIGV